MNFSTRDNRRRFYKSAKWSGKHGIREQALRAGNYECSWCAKEGRVTTINDATLEVDHVLEIQDRPDLALELSNTRVLCVTCHNLRHNRFSGKKSNNKWQDERWD